MGISTTKQTERETKKCDKSQDRSTGDKDRTDSPYYRNDLARTVELGNTRSRFRSFLELRGRQPSEEQEQLISRSRNGLWFFFPLATKHRGPPMLALLRGHRDPLASQFLTLAGRSSTGWAIENVDLLDGNPFEKRGRASVFWIRDHRPDSSCWTDGLSGWFFGLVSVLGSWWIPPWSGRTRRRVMEMG
jgi:hypothetical protein